jgi:hypothetical protein
MLHMSSGLYGEGDGSPKPISTPAVQRSLDVRHQHIDTPRHALSLQSTGYDVVDARRAAEPADDKHLSMLSAIILKIGMTRRRRRAIERRLLDVGQTYSTARDLLVLVFVFERRRGEWRTRAARRGARLFPPMPQQPAGNGVMAVTFGYGGPDGLAPELTARRCNRAVCDDHSVAKPS